jgi:NAD-dependent deacetylase
LTAFLNSGMAMAVIFSGAGLSAESGVPTFRDKGGLWERNSIDEVANFCTFEQNRVKAFKFFNEFRGMLATVRHNAAHEELARLQKLYGREHIVLITQNVDDLLERAGCTDVLHVHGCLWQMQCLDCCHVWDIGYGIWAPYEPCPAYASFAVKPHVVLFNEMAPRYADMYEAIDLLTTEDCFVALGTSSFVVPVGSLISGFTGRKILCNLETSAWLGGRLFDHCYDKPVTQAMKEISGHIEEVLAKKPVSVSKQ